MKPRIAIPIPTSFDPAYNSRSWPNYASAVERSGGEAVPIPLDQPPAETARLIASCSAVLLPGSGADVNPQKYGEQPDPASAPPDPARENVDELLLQDAHNMGKPILTVCFGTQMLNVWRGGSLIQDLPTALPANRVSHKAGSTILDAHAAQIPADSLLGRIVAEAEPSATTGAPGIRLTINSSHHQAIATPGDGLRISALSLDDHVIEAIEGIPPATHPASNAEPGATNSQSGPAHPQPGATRAEAGAAHAEPDAAHAEPGAAHAKPVATHPHPAPGAPAWSPFILGVQWHPERTFDHSPTSRALFARLIAEAQAWAPRHPTT